MNQPSCSDSQIEEIGLESSSRSGSSSPSSTEVYSAPLGFDSSIILSQDEQNLLEVPGNLSVAQGAQSVISNSPNAWIGTNFNVSVDGDTKIIVNNIHAPVENSPDKNGEVTNSGSPLDTQQKFPDRLKHFCKERPTQFWLAGLLLGIISIASLVLFFCLFNYNGPMPVPPSSGHDDNLGNDIQVIHREEWLARPPLNTTAIPHPLKMVRILHSGGVNCSDYQTCANKVLGLQGYHVGNNEQPDIAYNFMIGGDGNVYVGRGGEVQNDDRSDAIDIAYIGNYLAPYDKISDKMEEAGKRLINRLLERGQIAEDYIVVAQNQTDTTTISPGENVYKKIIHWPHYKSGLYLKN